MGESVCGRKRVCVGESVGEREWEKVRDSERESVGDREWERVCVGERVCV